jgi:hypothetical protein
MQKTIYFLISISFLVIPGCATQVNKKPIAKRVSIPVKNLKTAPIAQEAPTITVWVHGTRLLPKGVLPTFFFSKPGLHHYQEIDAKYYQRKIAQTLIDADPALFPSEEFYLFGWSGKLSFTERKEAALNFYKDLKEVRQAYRKRYGVEPCIRMLAHSHGGNVILLLEEVKDADDINFVIDELILLAVPVQVQTMEHVCSPIFKKIYSLYSILDILQVIDPQGLQQDEVPLFSKRAFACQEKIEQVAIKMNDRSIMHMEFIKPKFLSALPSIINEINEWRAHCTSCSHGWIEREKCLCIKIRK